MKKQVKENFVIDFLAEDNKVKESESVKFESFDPSVLELYSQLAKFSETVEKQITKYDEDDKCRALLVRISNVAYDIMTEDLPQLVALQFARSAMSIFGMEKK